MSAPQRSNTAPQSADGRAPGIPGAPAAPATGQGPAAQHNRARAGLWIDIARLLREFWAAHPLAATGALAVHLAGNARTGLYMLAMQGVVDALVYGGSGGHSAVFWAALYVAARALEEAYWTVEPVLSAYLLDHGSFRIRDRVLERAAAAALIQFEEREFFDHLQRASAGTGERLVQVYGGLVQLLRWLVMLASIGAALFVVHPVLPALLAAGTLPSLWLNTRVATVMYQVQRAHTTRDRIRQHLQRLLTGREAAAEIRLFDNAGYLVDQWRWHRHERKRDVLAGEQRRARDITGGSLVAGLSYAVALVVVALLILRGELTAGDYVALAWGAGAFQGMLSGLVSTLTSLEEQSQYLGDLFDFWRVARVEGDADADEGRKTKDESWARPAGQSVLRPSSCVQRERGLTLEAEDITFTYPGGSAPALRGVRLRIGRGERIAIVGENGAGKTTLVRLLIGLYQPAAGIVRVDGVPLVGAHALAARRRIAAVFQDYGTYQLSARENIGFGDLARLHDDAALLHAAERAGIGDFIRSLPKGLDTYLGRQFGDTELSGGQWQRVALARAFFRDADLLVLDEPTAALDPLAELALFERFVELVEGRTAIMISHRLGVARLADRILVLRGGEVVEEGRHDDLVARGGEYAALFAAQAQWYR